jgi:hypothetical protein
MRRALPGAWLILAAGSLLAAPGARAQPAAKDAERLTEIRVELAWLADPVVCPYYPSARVEGGFLEVGGYVPDDLIRARVMQLAARQAGLKVVDRLQVNTGLAVSRVSVPAATLQRAALATVRAEFPACTRQVSVSCSADGQLTVAGVIDSPEQKLRVSQRLRRLPGCGGVVNNLQVAERGEKGLPLGSPPGRDGLTNAGPAAATPASAPTTAAPVPVTRSASGPVPPAPPPLPANVVACAAIQGSVSARLPLPRVLPAEPAAGVRVTEGYVVLVPPGPEPAPTFKVVPAQQARLRQRVKEACPEALAVEVVFTSPGEAQVRLRVADPFDGERLTARVRALSDLAPYHLAVTVQLAR